MIGKQSSVLDGLVTHPKTLNPTPHPSLNLWRFPLLRLEELRAWNAWGADIESIGMWSLGFRIRGGICNLGTKMNILY